MLLVVFAWIFHRRIVYLQDCWGRTYRTWAKQNIWGEWEAPVYWMTNIGSVILLPDGTTTGQSCYIERWKWAYHV